VQLEIHHLDQKDMETFLERRRASLAITADMSLAENLAEILRKANEFVPSSAGSILLDNPLEKHPEKSRNRLTFVAAFGEKSRALIGCEITADRGIAGRVYTTGEPHHTGQAHRDRFFFAGIDEKTDYRTQSIVAIPIRIEHEVCGVLELINRQGVRDFSEEDRNLLQIFAGYISISIQNILGGLPRRRPRPRTSLPRSRLLQARQRHLRPPGRQPGPARGRLSAQVADAYQRGRAYPLRRRRVRARDP
jgi:GAF domain-containing protein